MPVRLADLRNQRKTLQVEVTLAGEDEAGRAVEERVPVTVTFNPGAITEAMIKEVANNDSADENALNVMLAKVLVGWDVLDDDGGMLAIQDEKGKPAASLALVPIPFKSTLLQRVMEEVAGNARSAESSGAGLQPKGR